MGNIDFLCGRGTGGRQFGFFLVFSERRYCRYPHDKIEFVLKATFLFIIHIKLFMASSVPLRLPFPPSEVFVSTYFYQTSFLTKNKKFPSNKARPSISEFYFTVVMSWSRDQARAESSVSFPQFLVSSHSYDGDATLNT